SHRAPGAPHGRTSGAGARRGRAEAADGRLGDGGAGRGSVRAGGRAGEAPVTGRWPYLPPRADALRHRLIFALGVDTPVGGERLVRLLAKEVGIFKIGKQLFLTAGPEVVRMVLRHGADVFLDLKFHDIPHTVAKAGVAAARLGVRFFDVHASGSF